MAHLQVFKEGQKIKEIEIQSGKDWIIGRSSSCDLVLDGERGISRQHLKISFTNGKWNMESLSRYGELYQSGNKIQSLQLENGSNFEIPPFAFLFEDVAETKTQDEAPHSSSQGYPDAGDRTMIGHFSISPHIRVCDSNGLTVQVFQLDGHAWVAGRDTSCAIFLDKPEFSRRHFEIRFEEGAYLIKDLQSSNGTLLNDQVVSHGNWAQLKSGDVISVADWKIYFELRDSTFEQKLKEIPQDLQNQSFLPTEVQPEPMGFGNERFESQDQGPRPQHHSHPEPAKKINRVRILIGALIVGGSLAYLLQGNGDASSEPAAANKSAVSPFEKLAPQQQQYIKDTYRLADRLFKEGRYEMARQEVAKIHQLIPNYEESKNLEKLADVAIQTQIEQQKAEVREKEKFEMEEKIQRTVAECQKKVNSNVTMQIIDDCLMPVVPLNPDHPAILALKGRVDQLVAARTMRNEKRTEYLALVNKQKRLFDQAEGVLQKGQPLAAIVAYETVVNSKFPDPQQTKTIAKRKIASLQQQLTSKQSNLEKDAEASSKKGDLKTAIVTLKKALEINPENETLKGRVNSMMSDLRKQMQVLYQEGVLEESVGEIETAKTKWKKILEASLPDEDYYKKAKSKLKKYVAE